MIDNKFDLGFFPTPLQELRNLSKSFDEYNVFIKRDDNTGLASGGNKTRKLEYLIQQAIDSACDTIITSGAQQSNHCRQTAAACSIAGLNCHLLLGGEKPDHFEGNLLLSSLLGANIHFSGENRKGEDSETLKEKLNREGKNSFVIPYGGSNITGVLGFVNAVRELKDQMSKQEITLDYIFFASSSGGMQAGLMLGKELFQLSAELMPINIDKLDMAGIALEEIVLNLINEGSNLLGLKKQFTLTDIPLIRDYDKDGYGVVTEKEILAIKTLAQKEGILLDPVYTGRAFYAMLDIIKNKKIAKKSSVLFWHSGGLPALFNTNIQ